MNPGDVEITIQPHQEKFLKNITLMNNLSAYILRHREDKERMVEIVMRDITNPPKIDKMAITQPSPSYLARLCFMINIMSPESWKDVIETWKSDAYFIIENNDDAVAHCFQTINIVPFLKATNMHFFLGYRGEDVIAPLQFVLRQTIHAGKLPLSQFMGPSLEDGIDKPYVEYATSFPEIFTKTMNHVSFNFGHIADSVAGLEAALQNSPRLKASGGVTELENIHVGKPMVVVGAGPSLDKDIDLLTANQDKFIIVAVDAAVEPLIRKGCRVDYVSTIERYNGFQEKFFEKLPPMEADLVCFPVVHRDVIKLYPGVVRFAYRNYAWFAYFERNWPMGVLESGGCAYHLSAKLALHLGASKIYLVGCDMTYEKLETEDKWRSHCLNTVYAEDWDKYYSEAEIKAKPEFWGFYDVEANDNSQVKTHLIYHQWAKEFASMMIRPESRGRIVTTAAKGVKTPRLEYESLQSVVDSLKPIDTARKCPANTRKMKHMDHAAMQKNIQGIYDTVTECLDILSSLIQNPDAPSGEAVRLIRNTLYDKLAYDTFFTAFYIQNAAMEFFKAEARFYEAPTPKDDASWEDEHYMKRCWGLYWVFTVLESVGDKTLDVIEKVEKELANGESILQQPESHSAG